MLPPGHVVEFVGGRYDGVRFGLLISVPGSGPIQELPAQILYRCCRRHPEVTYYRTDGQT